jgi:hypothetical protein
MQGDYLFLDHFPKTLKGKCKHRKKLFPPMLRNKCFLIAYFLHHSEITEQYTMKYMVVVLCTQLSVLCTTVMNTVGVRDCLMGCREREREGGRARERDRLNPSLFLVLAT